MTFQQARTHLAEAIESLVVSDGWRVTTETSPDIFHKLIAVGHADVIEPEMFGEYKASLTVTAWVSEADEVGAVDDLYALISPTPDSFFFALTESNPVFGEVSVTRAQSVGLRNEGPSGFLAAEIPVTLTIATQQGA